MWVRESGKQAYLGGYASEEEAAEAHDVAALKCHGLKAKTNFHLSRHACPSGHLSGGNRMLALSASCRACLCPGTECPTGQPCRQPNPFQPPPRSGPSAAAAGLQTLTCCMIDVLSCRASDMARLHAVHLGRHLHPDAGMQLCWHASSRWTWMSWSWLSGAAARASRVAPPPTGG